MKTEKILQISGTDLDGLEDLIKRAINTVFEERKQQEYLNRFDKYPEQMTKHEVAEAIGVSPNYVPDLAKQGRFTRFKVSPRKSFYLKKTVKRYWEGLTAKQ